MQPRPPGSARECCHANDMTPETPDFVTARHDLTALLHGWTRGDHAAVQRLTDIVYPQVLAIATRYLRQFGNSLALGPTELANELLLRLLERPPQWRDSRHFFGVVVVAMRNLLIDWSRSPVNPTPGPWPRARYGSPPKPTPPWTCPTGSDGWTRSDAVRRSGSRPTCRWMRPPRPSLA